MARHALEPLNSPNDTPEPSADAMIVRGMDGRLHALPRPVEPIPERNPFAEKLPSEEEFAAMVAAQSQAYSVVEALTIEQAALPGLWMQAVSDGDAEEMTRLKEREGLIPNELILASIAAARKRFEVCQARLTAARVNREAASTRAYAVGRAEGWPEGMEAGLEAESVYAGFQIAVTDSAIALGQARRDLDSAIRAASFGGSNHV